MSEFRDKLIALGRGQATLADVTDSLDELIDESPEATAAARKLLDAAKRGGLSEQVHARLVRRLDAAHSADPQATSLSRATAPRTSLPGAETVVSESPADAVLGEATRLYGGDTSAPGAGATLIPRDAGPRDAAAGEATVMSGADRRADGGTDRTAPDVADDEATRFSSRRDETAQGGTGETTSFDPGPPDTDATVLSDGGERTLLSVTAIEESFDILDERAMAAAESSLSDASWDTGTAETPATTGHVVFREGSVLRTRFKLQQKLGEGGMGAVWKGVDKLKEEARDRNPYVAIKLLQGDFRDHPEAFIALQRETAKQQRLAHPNIATVFDFDRDDSTNTVFMTMEVLSGVDLAAHIRRNLPPDGLPYETAMEIIEQLGNGLAYAHQAGLVHSDLKPGNCFLTDEGVVKLLDFGIARASKTKADADGETTVFDPGELGALTPAYATIEMFDGVEPDPRDDIYAMAIITFQLLTGKHPFGRGMNAPKAEAQGLTMPPIDKLTKAQNRALARGLAFRRENRTETVEEFLEGLRPPKRNVPLVVGAVAVALALIFIVTPFVTGYLEKQEREEIIATIQSPSSSALARGLATAVALGDEQRKRVLEDERTRAALIDVFTAGGEANIDRGLTLARSVSAAFALEMKNVPAVEDAIVALYRDKARHAFDPAQDRLDYAAAMAEVDALKNIVPRAAGVITLRSELSTLRDATLRDLETRFATLIDGGQILPVDGADDIFTVRDRIARIEPGNSIVTSGDVTATAAELAKAAYDDGDLERARALLQASLAFAPAVDSNANLRYEVDEALRRQRNAELVAAIETRLSAQRAGFDSLAAFQAVRDELIRLADLAPESAVLADLQSSLTAAFDTALNERIGAADWTAAESLLVDFAKLFPLDYLDSRRRALTAAESEAGFAMPMTPERTAAVAQRRATIDELIATPAFGSDWEIALQVPFKEMTALLPAGDASMTPVREQIAALYIDEAETARASELTSRARSLVERGRSYHPTHARFDQQLALIAETDAVLEQRRLEAARVARIERNFKDAVNKAQAMDTAAAEAAIDKIEKDAGAEDAEKLAEARRQLGLALGRLAQSLGEQENWGQALKLIERAIVFAPGDAELATAAQGYRDEYRKVVAVEKVKEMLQATAPLDAGGIDAALTRVKADFPRKYETAYARDFATLAAARLGAVAVESAADLNQAALELAIVARHFGTAAEAGRARLAPRLARRVRAIESKSGVVAANRYLQLALNLAPKATELTSIKLDLPSKLAESGQRLVAQGKLSQAQQVLEQVLRETPRAPNVPPLRSALTQRLQLAERNFENYEKFKKRRLSRRGRPYLEQALAAWRDNPTYLAEMKSLKGPPPTSSRYACSAKKAGQGRNNRASCYDEIGSKRGPLMVVVPPGGGNPGAFAIGKLETTVADYNLFCAATGCARLQTDARLPATGISVARVEAYTAWLSQQTGARYRLPTDPEWQHAAKADGKPARKDFNCKVTVGNQVLKGQSLVTALSGKPNAWGLINYVGNAKEWARTGGGVVVRGGSYNDPMAKCDVTLQESHGGNADPQVGFRLVREIG